MRMFFFRSKAMRMTLRKFLSHRTVMPYSDTPPKPARIRSSSSFQRARASAIGSVSHFGSGGSVFRPAVGTTAKPSCAGKGREAERAAYVDRVPARQQRIDLKAVRQEKDVGEHPGLDLRDVDRVLLLVDAGLHAVVADAVAGAGAHGVVDHDDGQRGDGVA